MSDDVLAQVLVGEVPPAREAAVREAAAMSPQDGVVATH